jgi:4-aminobutyrate--pyruvate transaminase
VRYYNNALGRPTKKKIIARTKGYHGVSIASATLTGLPHLHTGFDLPGPEVVRADCPHHYRYAGRDESERAFSARLARQLEALIEKEGPENIAAFIAEPVMGAGGVIPPPAGYFDAVQPILRRHDILFIADEVICGFGRTGQMWGSQTYGIAPEIVTCAKALTGGYVPFSATMVSEKVYEPIAEQSARLGTFGHGYTYSSHPLGCAVAVEALKVYRETDIAAQVRAKAPQFQDGLREFLASPIVGEVRGVGLIAAVELVKDKATKESFPPAVGIANHFAERAHAHGLVVRPLGEAVALCPPLVITPAEMAEMLARFARALGDTEKHAQST